MSYQYVHMRNRTEGTIALFNITRTDLEHMFNTHSNKIVLISGLSLKSPKDRFIKKTGREEAHKKLTASIFDLISVEQHETTHVYILECSEIKHNRSTYKMRIKLSTVTESNKVRFIFGTLYA